MVERYVPGLKAFYAIAIDIGTKDNLLTSNRQLHEAMTRLKIAHSYEEYRRRPHQQGRRADRKERAAVLLEEPGVAGEPDVSGGPALIAATFGRAAPSWLVDWSRVLVICW